MSWEGRANIFLKAADLISAKYRPYMNGTTMLGQSKSVFQAEIDSACEVIDFLRFNVHFLSEIYKQQPISSQGIHNRMEYRPLEGFVLAITPFNFTAIGANLPTSAAMCGNVVIWKCANTQIYSAQMFMHPGPINRGVEIDSDVADSGQSIILQQVENGVAVRMAVLYLLSNRAASN